jgi:hypothetical protein
MVHEEATMPIDNRDPLEVLKFEMEFLDKGGYGSSPRDPLWPPSIFEDSLSCANYDRKEDPIPCEECVLMQFVPEGAREERVPCRHIPLTVRGETLDSLYRYTSQAEIEEALRGWLRTSIERLENERNATALVAVTKCSITAAC